MAVNSPNNKWPLWILRQIFHQRSPFLPSIPLPTTPQGAIPLGSYYTWIVKQPNESTKRKRVFDTTPGLVVHAIAESVLPFLFQRSIPQAMRTSSLSGGEYINKIMSCDNPRRTDSRGVENETWRVSVPLLGAQK